MNKSQFLKTNSIIKKAERNASAILGVPITLKMITKYPTGITDVSPHDILNEALSFNNVKYLDAVSQLRRREIVDVCTIAQVIIQEIFPQITTTHLGKMFNRDHSNVVARRKRHISLTEFNPEYRAKYIKTRLEIERKFPILFEVKNIINNKNE